MKINKVKWNKKSNLKKFFLSSLAVFSLAITATISGLNMNGINSSSSLVNNPKTLKNDVTSVSSFTPPEANDLYDDYSYANGFITISGSVISFTDWFGFQQWSFDVNANLGNLFGDASSKVSTLKVRSSSDGTQIFVYGYLMNDSSYLFRLNTNDGSISPITNKDAYTTKDGLVQDVNLLTIVDGCAILTPKTSNGTSPTSAIINFSEIDLNDGTLNNLSYDISTLSNAKSLYVLQYGEIIGVQKVDTRYCFEVVALRSTKGDTTKSYPSLIYAYFVNGTLNAASSNAMGWWTSADQSYIDIDDVTCCVLNITNSDGSVSTYVVPKYDTTSTTMGYPGTSTSATPTQIYYSAANTVAYSKLASNSFAVTPFTCSSASGSSDTVAGISNLLLDQSANTAYAVLVDGNSTSKLAITSLSNATAATAPGWIDLSATGISTSNNEILNLEFIPGTSNSINSTTNGYSGYLEVEQQQDLSISTLSGTKSFVLINSSGTSLTTINDLSFSLAMSDSEINDKYKAGKYKADQTTKDELISDLIKVNQAGNLYTNVSYTDDINITNQSLKGQIVISLDNWWNSGTTQITRYVDINLATVNVIMWSVIAVAILVVIAVILIICKVIQSKKAKSFKEEM